MAVNNSVEQGEAVDDFTGNLVSVSHYSQVMQCVLDCIDLRIEKETEDCEKLRQLVWNCLIAYVRQAPVYDFRLVTERTSLDGLRANFKEWGVERNVPAIREINFQDPASIAVRGYQAIIGARNSPNSIMELAWGIALVGWAGKAFHNIKMCKYCFRWALPTSIYCGKHSQAYGDARTAGERYGSYRIGRRTRAKADASGAIIRIPVSRNGLESYRATLLGDVLFFWLPNDDEMIEIRSALSNSMRVLHELGGKSVLGLNDPQLFSEVTKWLDPIEVIPFMITEKILLAERWLEIEQRRSKKGRPPSSQLRENLKAAIDLYEKGKSKSQICRELGVKRSAISNWINRFPEFRKAIEERAQ